MSNETDGLRKPFDLSDGYWSRLKPEHQALYLRVRPMPTATYTVDVGLNHIESWLKGLQDDMVTMNGSFELEPDFQRGHVWTLEQRTRYMESFIRAAAARTIMFNCPGWNREGGAGDINSHTFQCIDGLQRLTAIRRFMADEVPVFDGLVASMLEGTPFDPVRMRIQVAIYEFRWRADLLQFYLDHNSGGTVHPKSELDRVRLLQSEAAASKLLHK